MTQALFDFNEYDVDLAFKKEDTRESRKSLKSSGGMRTAKARGS